MEHLHDHYPETLRGHFLPKEERMAHAIAAVQSGKMSQRAATEKFDISRASLQRELKVAQMSHPATAQSQPEVQPINPDQPPINKLTSNERLKALRQLCKDNGLTTTKLGNQGLYDLLLDNDVDVADYLITPTLLKNHTPKDNDTNEQGISSNNPEPDFNGGDSQIPFNDDGTLDLDAYRKQVNIDIQQSDRPRDFKRAIELLTELDIICTDAWYRRQPEPWEACEWSHVSSEIEGLHSIVSQRAAEIADDILRQSSAVSVEHSVIS
jgi:hypothetical protein